MTTPIDRESVERFIAQYTSGAQGCVMEADDAQAHAEALSRLCAALDAAEATSARIVSAYRINMMRHTSNYSHEAFDQHIAALQENPDG